MKKNKFALVSVYNKKNLSILCEIFKKFDISIVATDSTSTFIKKLGFNCSSVSSFTKFGEILDGRIKTLNHKLHASLLYKRKNKKHSKEFKQLKFPIIDFVIVNLYPFEKTLKSAKTKKRIIEMIDIGGPTLLRSAAKNFESVTTISNINDYELLIEDLKKNNGMTSLKFRKKMASKVFELTAKYDEIIYKWLNKKK